MGWLLRCGELPCRSRRILQRVKHGKKEFVHCLSHAEGSLAELDTQLALAIELGYPRDPNDYQSIALVGELQRMLATLRGKIEVRLATNH
jgi:four helix bundle protein